MGLMVSELKDHLLRHLQGVEKKKIEQMVLDYVSKLMSCLADVLLCSLTSNRQASAAEFAVFHIMTRILEATNSLFLPLPPDLDNTEKNEKVKFSIIVRLPPPRSSMMDKSSFSVEFLPLNYFIEILTDIESSNPALYAFEGHDNVDAKFVEEAALKHTTMLLGL
eukprot:bmy_04356T0